MAENRDAESTLKTLRDEHRALEVRLSELDRHISLTPAEQVERAELKKLKLAKKDAIERISREAGAEA